MQPRLRRLVADYERVKLAFTGHPRIQLVAVEGDPPEKYVFQYAVKGLVPDAQGRPAEGACHRAEVFLPLEYPRRPPFCRMITPVFHPNIDPQKICIGDHWSAGQTLDQLVAHIGQIISFQSYNTKSPLNAVAAAWVDENLQRLPLDTADLSGLG